MRKSHHIHARIITHTIQKLQLPNKRYHHLIIIKPDEPNFHIPKHHSNTPTHTKNTKKFTQTHKKRQPKKHQKLNVPNPTPIQRKMKKEKINILRCLSGPTISCFFVWENCDRSSVFAGTDCIHSQVSISATCYIGIFFHVICL